MTTARQRKAARAAEGVPPPPVGFNEWFAATYGARPEKSRVELVDAQNLAHRALNKARAALAQFDLWESTRAAALAGWKAGRP